MNMMILDEACTVPRLSQSLDKVSEFALVIQAFLQLDP